MKISRTFRATVFILIFTISLSSIAFAAEGNNQYPNSYAVNQNGETYGTAIQASIIGYEPDLLLAHGTDGTVGYVRTVDLNDACSTPAEAQKNMTQEDSALNSGIDRVIPLLLSDGETVVGEFRIVTSVNSSEQPRSSYTYGAVKTKSMPGYIAYGVSGIKLNLTSVDGITTVSTSNLVEIGWIGIQSRIYCQEDNAMVECSSYAYNQSKTMSFSLSISHFTLSSDHYYSQGRVLLWDKNQSSYIPYITMYRSPNV